ncbi:Leucine-rich repeat-containing protein 45, partial [Entophlyctis luteolus]
MTALCAVLSEDASITSVALSDMFLGDDGTVILCGSLKKNGTVTHLNLRGNNIRSDGAIAIAQMLKVNTSLKSLVLEWNCLGIWECGIKALADALLVNDSLEDLDLRNCKISPQGVNALSIGIKNNHRLRKLGNAGLTGGKGLLQTLKSNHTLTVLSLAGNEIPDTLLQAIHSCIDRNECRAKDEENAKTNANFLSSTFQQLAKSHQDTIDGLSMKLELSKEVADDARDQLRVVSNELRKMMVEKKELDLKLMDKEKQIEEASFSISELRKELLTEKE